MLPLLRRLCEKSEPGRVRTCGYASPSSPKVSGSSPEASGSSPEASGSSLEASGSSLEASGTSLKASGSFRKVSGTFRKTSDCFTLRVCNDGGTCLVIAASVTARHSPAGDGNPRRRHLFEYVFVNKKSRFVVYSDINDEREIWFKCFVFVGFNTRARVTFINYSVGASLSLSLSLSLSKK